ncbi:MAG: hypothetical protein V5A38_12340 [Halolamina sp.]|uniref:hypothetical protein n=1 Tax=Halolamina sp. TaxID=1940283 RepID=UPI002FC2D049
MSRTDTVDSTPTGGDGARTAESKQWAPIQRSPFANYHLLGPVLRGVSVRQVVDASPYRRRSSSERSDRSE